MFWDTFVFHISYDICFYKPVYSVTDIGALIKLCLLFSNSKFMNILLEQSIRHLIPFLVGGNNGGTYAFFELVADSPAWINSNLNSLVHKRLARFSKQINLRI